MLNTTKCVLLGRENLKLVYWIDSYKEIDETQLVPVGAIMPVFADYYG